MIATRTVRGKHVLVTGGAGFIGSHLVDGLIARGAGALTVVDSFFLGKPENLADARLRQPGVRVEQLDASDIEALRALMRGLPPVDVVFDLAVIPLPTSLERPRWCFETNVGITSALCELLREGHFETLVHFSSSEAYGSARTVPMSEEHPLDPLTPYAASKSAGDHLVRTYAATFGVDALVVRPFNNYGPRQNEKQYAGIVPTLIKSVLEQRPFTLFGDGEQTRDYLYVADTVRAALALYECPEARGQVVNVGSGRELSILDLLASIERIIGEPARLLHAPPRPGDVRRHRADITLLQRLVGFEPEITLDDGLASTIDYYRRAPSGSAERAS